MHTHLWWLRDGLSELIGPVATAAPVVSILRDWNNSRKYARACLWLERLESVYRLCLVFGSEMEIERDYGAMGRNEPEPTAMTVMPYFSNPENSSGAWPRNWAGLCLFEIVMSAGYGIGPTECWNKERQDASSMLVGRRPTDRTC